MERERSSHSIEASQFNMIDLEELAGDIGDISNANNMKYFFTYLLSYFFWKSFCLTGKYLFFRYFVSLEGISEWHVSTVVSFLDSLKSLSVSGSSRTVSSILAAVHDDWCRRGNRIYHLRKVRVRRRSNLTLKQLWKFSLDNLL